MPVMPEAPVRSGEAEGPVPANAQRFLALDFGLRRTGVATGNRLTRTATPQRTIHAAGKARWAPIAAEIAEWHPDALVVGVPYHPDGTPHENTRRAQRFARQLRGRTGLPVYEVDERYTTTRAQEAGAPDTDAAAAAIILQQFLGDLG